MKTTVHQFDDKPLEIYGLSTDEKPLDVNNASIFYEMDTKTAFLYDAENEEWIKQ